jgi:hypothetical protein
MNEERWLAGGPPSNLGAPEALVRDFLFWLSATPRTYAEAIDAWGTHCPKFPVWEDAFDAELVEIASSNGTPLSQSLVTLSPRGRAMLGQP